MNRSYACDGQPILFNFSVTSYSQLDRSEQFEHVSEYRALSIIDGIIMSAVKCSRRPSISAVYEPQRSRTVGTISTLYRSP